MIPTIPEHLRNRPTFEDIMMGFAESLSRRSTCRRLKVGCVIASTDFRRVYAIGYNGNARGGPNDCDVVGEEAVGRCGCVHAEANAAVNCDVPRHFVKVVFVTCLPCVACAKLLINMGGVERVYFRDDYRDPAAREWLQRAGVDVRMHDPAWRDQPRSVARGCEQAIDAFQDALNPELKPFLDRFERAMAELKALTPEQREHLKKKLDPH